MTPATQPLGAAGRREVGHDSPEDPNRTQLWLIEPNADPDDPWWQGRPIWQLVVSAPSAAFARLEAERWALRQRRSPPADRVLVGNESSSMNAGFVDARLYHARLMPEGGLPAADLSAKSQNPGDVTVTVLAGPMPSQARA